jgi:hypothetical protein
VSEGDDQVQAISDGAGPRYHRVYGIDLPVSFESAAESMRKVMLDPNSFSPKLIATFEKTLGEPGELRVGDEFIVHISGPWNGPVRVSEVGETSFSLVTLNGHIEAGQIQFRLVRKDEDRSRFEIESITRSKDQIVDFVYDKLRFAQFAQTEMWGLFCKSVASDAVGETAKDLRVEVRTERQNPETLGWEDVSDQLGAKGIS